MNPGDFAITPNGNVVQVLGPEPAVLVIYDDDSMAVLPEADLEPYTPEAP